MHMRNMAEMIDAAREDDTIVAACVNHRFMSWEDARQALNFQFDNDYRAPVFSFTIWTKRFIIAPRNDDAGVVLLLRYFRNPEDAMTDLQEYA